VRYDVLMSEESPKITPLEIEQVDTLEKKEHEIILYNDDVNTFDHVIECLVKICEHSYLQAEQCAYIVHYSGKCSVKTGALEELIPKCTALLEEGLSAEVV
jgi:ATP-dependent Clp protease adaptor protein ClpS